MRIEYAITAGEGRLLAYGVTNSRYVAVSEYAAHILEDSCWDDGYYSSEFWYDEGVTIIARPCPNDCETGK